MNAGKLFALLITQSESEYERAVDSRSQAIAPFTEGMLLRHSWAELERIVHHEQRMFDADEVNKVLEHYKGLYGETRQALLEAANELGNMVDAEQKSALRNLKPPSSTSLMGNAIESALLEAKPQRWSYMMSYVNRIREQASQE